MSRRGVFIKNTFWELGYYLLVILLGFFAPRYIIMVYGSEVNGLTTTITQTLNLIMILQVGATTASIFELYKPFAEKNKDEICDIVSNVVSYYRGFSFFFLFIMIIVALTSSLMIQSDLPPKEIFLAFIIMGLKSFLDLAFTSRFRVVFTAAQKKYIVSIATMIEQVVYYMLVFIGLSLRIYYLFIYVWFLFGCLCKIIFFNLKYKRSFDYIQIRRIKSRRGQIKGRNYSLATEVSYSIVGASITVLISFLYGLEETSVYSIYALVSSALYLIATAVHSSFAPGFGNLFASADEQKSGRVFKLFQYLYIMLNSYLYLCMLRLVLPFVQIYTSGATDLNYANELLAILLCLQGLTTSFRVPYSVIVSSCGLFKETWKQPVIASLISVVVSLFFARFNYALVLVGPIVFNISNFIYLHIKLRKLVSHLITDEVFVICLIPIIGFGLTMMVNGFVQSGNSIYSWIINAVVFSVGIVVFLLLGSLIIARKMLFQAFAYFQSIVRRKPTLG